eukprot:Partr_v1_DN28908_c1_g1_i9_m26109 putative listerin E3 ubiquitin protein ligase 1
MQMMIPLGMKNFEMQKSTFKLVHTLTVEQVNEMSAAAKIVDFDKLSIINAAILPTALILECTAGCRMTNKHETFKYLLAAMLLLDYFEFSEFTLKSQYAIELHEKGTMKPLLAVLFDLVGLNVAERKPFDLEKWEIQYFDILNIDMTAIPSLTVLAAHIYWRLLKFLPSQVRKWFVECNDRQLLIAVESYTEKFFGAVLVRDELAAIKDSANSFGDQMTVSVSRGTVNNEVSAVYKLDDNALEMVIKIPNCYPLKQVEIQGLLKVGVSDERWRRWLLNCNMVLASQNGSIKDALDIFRQNLEKHFDGIEDCAICYSVIGALDRSLPNKTCKICRNKFHPGCLYKWFKSSNNSSCPLCRTLF